VQCVALSYTGACAELRILHDIVRATDAEWREGHRREPVTLIKARTRPGTWRVPCTMAPIVRRSCCYSTLHAGHADHSIATIFQA